MEVTLPPLELEGVKNCEDVGKLDNEPLRDTDVLEADVVLP
jgi:hypothetical protein